MRGVFFMSLSVPLRSFPWTFFYKKGFYYARGVFYVPFCTFEVISVDVFL
jgi:hypothetical protein